QTALKWRWLYIGLAGILYLLRLLFFNLNAPGYLMAVESNLWIFGVFGFGHKYLNKPSALLAYLSQAAYPVYIIHMFVLYTGALIILPLQIPVPLKFVAIIAFTGLVCHVLYEFIIRRVPFLRPLFGLKEKTRKMKNATIPTESVEGRKY
ncbi:MAG: acyltransferase, partial [Robiginitalea sp.]